MVSLSEFVETFQEAWVQAFTLLQEAIKKRTSYGTNPRISLIQEWAIKNKQIVADKVMTEFSRYTSHDVN